MFDELRFKVTGFEFRIKFIDRDISWNSLDNYLDGAFFGKFGTSKFGFVFKYDFLDLSE